MNNSKYTTVGVLTLAFVLATSSSFLTRPSQSATYKVLPKDPGKEMQRDSARRLSALDGKFEKAEEARLKLDESRFLMENPLSPDPDNRVNIMSVHQDVATNVGASNALLNGIEQSIGTFNILSGCRELKYVAGKAEDILDSTFSVMPTEDTLLKKYEQDVTRLQRKLHIDFGFGEFKDIKAAQTLMDSYEQEIGSFVSLVKNAGPNYEAERKSRNGPFLELWEARVLTQYWLNECQRQYKTVQVHVQEMNALKGIIPK